jgi:hypothetical protein
MGRKMADLGIWSFGSIFQENLDIYKVTTDNSNAYQEACSFTSLQSKATRSNHIVQAIK